MQMGCRYCHFGHGGLAIDYIMDMLVKNVVEAATENVGVILDNATKKQEEQDEVEGEDEEEGEHVDEDNVDNHEDDANKFINGKCQNI